MKIDSQCPVNRNTIFDDQALMKINKKPDHNEWQKVPMLTLMTLGGKNSDRSPRKSAPVFRS